VDINLDRKEVSTALISGIIFILLALGVFFLTWQNLRQQQEQVREHLALSAESIGRSIESNLYRGAMRGMGGMRWMNSLDFVPAAEDLLRELLQEGDVIFFALYGEGGEVIFSSRDIRPVEFHPDPEMLDMAVQEGWRGEIALEGERVFVYGFRARRVGHRMGRAEPEAEAGSGRGVVFIALDMSGHLEAYTGYKRTIIVQAAFTLAAIFIIGSLVWGYLRKKEQGRQFTRLSSFHSRLLDNMPDGLLSVDQDLDITAANPAAKELLGQGSEILGKKLSSFLPLQVEPGPDAQWDQVELADKSLEVLYLPIKEEQELLVLLRDRTKMRELEGDLEHSRRLAAVGRFAAGLAHEIRNPLGSLKGFAQYFQQKFAGEEPAAKYARTMASEADRLNRVINDLLYLSRPRGLSPVHVDLNELFAQVGVLLHLDLQSMGARLHMDAQDVSVQADADLLKQALINLVLNSLQAVDRDRGEISLTARQQDSMVCIEVADNGQGMDIDARDKAMEPFFSTRDQGSGLGLAIVHRIVQDHKGKISIDSWPGQGTTVSLYLPGYQGKDA